MKIVALIVQGCKNREIGLHLATTDQIIKNNLAASSTRRSPEGDTMRTNKPTQDLVAELSTQQLQDEMTIGIDLGGRGWR